VHDNTFAYSKYFSYDVKGYTAHPCVLFFFNPRSRPIMYNEPEFSIADSAKYETSKK
jgi:hypothetical protein